MLWYMTAGPSDTGSETKEEVDKGIVVDFQAKEKTSVN